MWNYCHLERNFHSINSSEWIKKQWKNNNNNSDTWTEHWRLEAGTNPCNLSCRFKIVFCVFVNTFHHYFACRMPMGFSVLIYDFLSSKKMDLENIGWNCILALLHVILTRQNWKNFVMKCSSIFFAIQSIFSVLSGFELNALILNGNFCHENYTLNFF